ncbi:MAG: hypothetical protein ACKO3V_16270 [Pirellula sp.]
MKQPKAITAVLLIVPLIIIGCNDSKTKPNAAQTNANSSGQIDDVVKIAVLTDGTVIVNSETVSIDSLAAKLDSMGVIKEIWYHREAPDAAEPHENAMKAIAEIANRKLPIAMYLDRDFKKRATFGE